MARSRMIPDEVRRKAEETVQRFNREHFPQGMVRYVARFKGPYLYLDREDFGKVGPICRLRYTGDAGAWEFAIFKYSSERYNPDEWMFPGSEAVDGTIDGAMVAGLNAYSP